MTANTSKTAAQIEAEGGELVELEWRGHTFRVPASADDWPMDVTLAYENGRGASAVRQLIGGEAWAKLSKEGLKTKDVTDLSNEIVKLAGLGTAGE